MASMAHVGLTGVGIAPTGYARGAHAVVVEIVATKGVLGVQPLWTHSIDFPIDLTRRLHDLTRRHVGRSELLALDNEIGGHYAELVEDLLVGARIGDRQIQFVAMQGVAIGAVDEHPGTNLPAELKVAHLGITVVSDFAAADMTAGGCGSPIDTLVDHQMFEEEKLGTLVVSLGALAGIAVLPPAGSDLAPFGFTAGPGMVLNEILALHGSDDAPDSTGGDRPNVIADPREALLARLLRHPYLETPPPKSTGVGPFGARLIDAVRKWPEAEGVEPAELAATFRAFTARAIADAVERFVPGEHSIERTIVGGTGASDPELVTQLKLVLPDCPVLRYEMFGLPGGSRDAITAAMLGATALAGIPNNVLGSTGASEPVVMGKIAQGENFNALRGEALSLRSEWLGQ